MITSSFFNSVAGDRKYDASKFAEYFASFIGNGVFPEPANGLQVEAQLTPDMTVTVKAGKVWINGYIMINDDDYILTIEPADGLLNRIDRIVARYDVVDREIRIEVKKGTFASSPVAPTLQRDADSYELALADIVVNAGVVSILEANITDLRKDKELCGLVDSLIAGDINALVADLAAHKEDVVAHEIASFSTYIGDIQLQPNIAKDIIIPLGKKPLRSVKFWGGMDYANANIQIVIDLISKDAYYVYSDFKTASYFKLDTAISLGFYGSEMKLIKVSIVNSNLILTLKDTATQGLSFKAFTEAI